MVTKQNIIHWHLSGMSQRSIARQVKVSRRTVQKVLREYESIRQQGNDDAHEDLLTTPPRYNTPQSGDSSGAILEVPFKALLHLPHARNERTFKKRIV